MTDAPESSGLLITAFRDFDGGWNCSDRLLCALDADRDRLATVWGGPLAFARFDVDTETIAQALREALRDHRPGWLLLMGQAAGRAGVSLERLARNRRNLRVADAAGRLGALGSVDPEGPAERLSTWPDLAGAAAALTAAGVPTAVSDDAGAHLCNQTLYLALGIQGLRATFLHLPLLPEQAAEGLPAAQRGTPTLPLGDMTRAVHALLSHTRRFAASEVA